MVPEFLKSQFKESVRVPNPAGNLIVPEFTKPPTESPISKLVSTCNSPSLKNVPENSDRRLVWIRCIEPRFVQLSNATSSPLNSTWKSDAKVTPPIPAPCKLRSPRPVQVEFPNSAP